MKEALLNIIHSSTLKTLSLTGLTELPTTFFSHILHLTTLELDSLLLNDFVHENSNSLTQATLEGLGVALMASQAVIDRCVWHLGDTPRDTSESMFLPFLCRLRFLKIYIELYSPTEHGIYDLNILSVLMDSLCMSLTSPATLEHLELNIHYHATDSINDVEDPFYDNLRGNWSHLDAIANPPTGPRLQRVDININYSFRCELYDKYFYEELEGFEDELLKSVLDGLPLLRAKGILLVKAALVDSESSSE